MGAEIIDGKGFAARLRERLGALTARAEGAARDRAGPGGGAGGRRPGERGLRAQQGPADASRPGCIPRSTGSTPATTEAALLALIARLNPDPGVHGILVQLPLPAHIDAAHVLDAVAPAKDVDGFHVSNVGRAGDRAERRWCPARRSAA